MDKSNKSWLLIQSGILFKSLSLDARGTAKLIDKQGPAIANVGQGVAYEWLGKSSRYFTDAILAQSKNPAELKRQIRIWTRIRIWIINF